MPLIQQSKFELNGSTGHVIEYDGVAIRMYDDAKTALTVIQLFEDKTITEAVKLHFLLDLLFPNPQGVIDAVEDLQGLIEYCIKELCGWDISKNHTHQKDVLNWNSDEAYIKASIWNAYGISFDAIASKVTYQELIQLIALSPFETPIGQALYYRTAKAPKQTKHNKEQVKDFKEKQRFWALRSEDKGTVDAGDGAMNDAFASLRRVAMANG